MKKVMVATFAGALAFTTYAGTASADHEGREFLVKLTSDEVVNEEMSVESDAWGEAHVKVSEDGDSIEYWLEAEYLEDATDGHLHSGPKGENGPPKELVLFEHDEPMDYHGEVASGTLTEDDLVGELTWEEFSMALVAGEVYIDIHTEEYPDGELRGQLDQYAQDAAMDMPKEMPQTGFGGSSNDSWLTNVWTSITSFFSR
ncbi:CHRD domain-containing protein [Alkalicoccobacillus porphyridii]|uniref:CHRD domain-containing protein n=1 Tax=Alkalicoccobacillus porphyridii TaxID=2597270 RepID=A0A554A025_9BACI|nr:CHRD domain-containing protein [Alkalicoccobacillus porphyridii]TSB47048.1 CHRD domain-containing protein [Alkalicoccobacillus porphyridii]